MEILKNQYLFRKIFYFVKYDRPNLISIYSILKESKNKNKNLMKELVKEKILNNNYLIFEIPKNLSKGFQSYEDFNEDKSEPDVIQILIETYKNENQFFFKSLFSNYSLYFITKQPTNNNNNNEKKQFDKLVRFILKSKSKSALKVLIKYHEFKPNIETFNISLLVNSSKEIVNLILSHLNQKEYEEIISTKKWNEVLKDKDIKFKLLNYLNEKFKNNENNENNQNNIKLPNYYRDPYDQSNLLNQRRPPLSFGRFISTCKYMVLHPNLSSFIQQSPTIEELEIFKSQFTKSELKLTLPNLFLKNQIYKENESIKKLYKFYIDYNNESSLRYNIIYNVDDLNKESIQINIEFSKGVKSIRSLFNLCLDFANFRFLNQWFNADSINASLNDETTIFSNCEKDEKQKLDFIMNVCNFGPLVLFLLLIRYDNIEILSKYIEKVKKTNNNGISSFGSSSGSSGGSSGGDGSGDKDLSPRITEYIDIFRFYTFSYIKSIEMLEYLFNNGFKDHLLDPKTSILYLNGRIDLLEKFKDLLLSDTNIMKDSNLVCGLFTKVENNKVPLVVINYMVNEPTGFFKSKYTFNNLESWLNQVRSDSDLQIIKDLINKSPLIKNLTYTYRITLLVDQKHQIELFNWIYEYRNDDIFKSGICRLSIIKYCNFLFLSQRFDELFKIQFFSQMVIGKTNFHDSNKPLLYYLKQQNGEIDNSLLESHNFGSTADEMDLISKSVGKLEDNGSIKFVQLLIENYLPLLNNDSSLSKLPKIKSFLFNVFQSCADSGKIEIFIYLNSNYQNILSQWLLDINLNIISHRYLKNYLSKIINK